MGNWDDIPDAYVPDVKELPTLHHIVILIREAVAIRHDLQDALTINAGERQLRPPTFISGVFKRTNSKYPKVYVAEHKKLQGEVNQLIQALTTQKLKDFLTKNIKRFMPDISGGKPLRRLKGTFSVLNQLLANREDMLIRLLLLDNAALAKRHAFFATDDGVYYF